MLLLPRHLRGVSFLRLLCLTSFFWKETEIHVKGQKLPTAAASPTAPTTVSSPTTGPAPGSFLLSTLQRSCSPERNPFDGQEWDEIVQNFTQRFNMRDYSCKNRCGVPVEERKSRWYRCYCDKFCDDFGDCCFDFDALCRMLVNSETSNETCLADRNSGVHGHTVWNTCPHNWAERSVRQKCEDEGELSDFLKNLPVFDKDNHVHYRNIFCARCNGAANTNYWKLQFNCLQWVNVTTFKIGNEMVLLPQNCLVAKFPLPYKLLFQIKRCIPHFEDCHNISPENYGSYCQTDCLRYAFPVCYDEGRRRFRNPQCALCNGFKLNDLGRQCESASPGSGGSPSLSILFDFSSTSKYTVAVFDSKGNPKITRKDFPCRLDEVYDTLAGSCKKTVSDVVSINTPTTGHEEKSLNCTVIAFNKTDYVQLPNGSVYVKPHNKIYNNVTYMIRGSRLLLCVNFSRNFTRSDKAGSSKYQISRTPGLLQILSSVGCIVSMISLVLLLITYILFAELRNLPGKIIINLALSLLLYQSVFFSANKTEDQDTCLAIAVLLHLFALASFTWMNVMAYDVHRIFASLGGATNRQIRQGSHTRRLVMYCLYAWGSPVLIVLSSVAVDQLKKGSIGYGQGEEDCFISQPQALLYSFVLPVALLMIFNMFALGHTVIRIVKTRKRAQQVMNQQHGSSVAVICVKMASVMGVTWILGIAANLKALSFLWYPYVVLNSLQGMFIFLSFAASGKALELFKSKLAGRPNQPSLADNRRNRNGSDEFICDANGGTQETHF